MTLPIPHRLVVPVAFATAFLGAMLVCSFYLTSVGMGSSRLPYYERYATALSEGHLWVEEKPDLAGCSWDLSFYNGKCYLYWGIVPALVHLALPFVSDRWVTLLMATAGVFFLVRILQSLSRQDPGPETAGVAATLPLFFFLTFLTGLPATVLAARVYEEAIATGIAFGLAGLYMFLPALGGADDPWSGRSIVLGVASLALAGLARAPWMAVALGGVLFLILRQWRARRWRGAKLVFYAAAIFAIGIVVQGVLNYVRFDDPFDFGIGKQASNAGIAATGEKAFSLSFVPQNLANYLFAALPPLDNPLTTTRDPYDLHYPRLTEFFMAGLHYKELGLGLFFAMPSLVFALPRLCQERSDIRRAAPMILMTAALALPVFANSGCMYRYQFEANLFLLLLLVPPLLNATAVPRSRLTLVHWMSLAVGAALVSVNGLWVIWMICKSWATC